jgi:cyclohexanone monooxygenase
VRRKIRATVKDPKTTELLCPNDHPVGTKRLILDTDYYETYNRNNVTLVDIRSKPIEEITPDGSRTADREYPLDTIVFATGVDAMTGAMKEIDIHTAAGMSIREKWQDGPRTYLGIMMPGFPNLFMITGPQRSGLKSQMILACEQHVDWIADCLQYMRDRGFSCIEADETAEDAWVRQQ